MQEARRRQEETGERKIAPSFKGRLLFRPGYPHPLDVMIEESEQLQAAVLAALGELVETLHRLEQGGDPAAPLSTEDETLRRVIRERYVEHKHRDHIHATFMALRRKCLLARLQAAQAVLEMVKDLLAPEDSLLQDLLAALQDDPKEADIEQAQLVGDARAMRARLARLDEQLQAIRTSATIGNGWFERFYVSKTRLSREFMELAKKKRPIPADLDPFETVTYGPYLKYRWREGPGPIYTISMGLIPDADS